MKSLTEKLQEIHQNAENDFALFNSINHEINMQKSLRPRLVKMEDREFEMELRGEAGMNCFNTPYLRITKQEYLQILDKNIAENKSEISKLEKSIEEKYNLLFSVNV